MNALLYLLSLFLMTSVGVFGIELPALGGISEQQQLEEVEPEPFVVVPLGIGSFLAYDAGGVGPLSPFSFQRPLYSRASPEEVAPSVSPTAAPVSPPANDAVTKNATNDEHVPSVTAAVSSASILALTNQERAAHGLPPLLRDPGLDHMAGQKLDDMVRLNYFEHTSPEGVGLAQLASASGYRYIIIGENLAYGTFTDARSIVRAWMESEGHRANILHDRYTHLGVAVRFVRFQGIDAWVAVQEFSVPASSCIEPDATLREAIEQGAQELAERRTELDQLEAHLKTVSKGSAEYNALVEEYNALVRVFRSEAEAHNELVHTYNDAVSAYRTCFSELSS